MTKFYDNPALHERQVRAQICPVTGNLSFFHTLTESSVTDTVDCVIPMLNVLPIVFVPGIMGSNLKGTKGKYKGETVWRLDSGPSALKAMAGKTAGDRQNMLHPARTVVDDRGKLPSDPVGILRTPEQFQARYWGEVSAISYQTFLIWLEESLNGGGTSSKHQVINQTLAQVQDGRKQWGAKKDFAPLTEQESKASLQWYYPVYACGYNWLDDNAKAAKALSERITTIIRKYNLPHAKCEQVLLITHSMGGLVARACSMLPGMERKIAGVVHGVMPAVGAAVAYRRCKVGMKDEGPTGMSKVAALSWGGNLTIGNTGQEITAVFAQAPGALQLLPTKQYPVQNWLRICDSDGGLLPEQPKTDDPYDKNGVYKERTKWWGLVNEEWLHPPGGTPIKWTDYLRYVDLAGDFHKQIQDHYHPNTWGFYGSRTPSFAGITWKLERGDAESDAGKPTPAQITQLDRKAVPLHGANPEYIPGPDAVVWSTYDGTPQNLKTAQYWLRLSSAGESGDGTVPHGSGNWPANPVQASSAQACIKQFFEVPGIEHEPAYKDYPLTQQLTVYAISKIAATLALPGKNKA